MVVVLAATSCAPDGASNGSAPQELILDEIPAGLEVSTAFSGEIETDDADSYVSPEESAQLKSAGFERGYTRMWQDGPSRSVQIDLHEFKTSEGARRFCDLRHADYEGDEPGTKTGAYGEIPGATKFTAAPRGTLWGIGTISFAVGSFCVEVLAVSKDDDDLDDLLGSTSKEQYDRLT